MINQSAMTFRLAATMLAGLVVGAASVRCDARTPQTPAQAYFANISITLNSQSRDLGHYTSVANAAADIYVQDGESIGAAGDPMFVWELCDRAGGLRQIEPDAPAGTLNRASWKGVVLYGLPDKDTATAQKEILALHANGDKVIVFGRKEILRDLELASLHKVGVGADWEIDNHAQPDTLGVSTDTLVPSNGVANMAAGWEFCAEFVGALTRRGKMPSMWQSISMPGAKERDASLDKVKFYPDSPTPIDAGILGRAYTDQLRHHMAVLNGVELPHIETLASYVKAAHAAGGVAYFLGDGHADPHVLDQEGVADHVFVSGLLDTADIKINAHDVVFLLGYNARYGSPEWRRLADDAHTVGAKVVYSFTDYDQAEVAALPAGDDFINQHWGAGDAEVTIKGYDVKVFPISGVLEDTIVYMAMADVVGMGG